MNGAAPRQAYGYDAGRPSAGQGMVPSARTLVEGYRKDVIGEFRPDQPRFNPMNKDRMQSSALVDLNDPIQVHLLTETALVDSKEYEILSQEEVDSLKKQVATLSQRIETARANLAVQSKFLDAATSMAKLYTSKRKTLLNVRNSGDPSSREAEAERQACERKCEELATELYSLEKRLMEPQWRLFRHTAGILQLTHRAAKSPSLSADGKDVNGIPGSPESMYTYNKNTRYSADAPGGDAFFDERSLYMPMEQYEDPAGRPRLNNNNNGNNVIDIPIKSPIRQETMQLRGEAEKLREENARLRSESEQLKAEAGELRATADSLQLEVEAMRRENTDQLQLVSDAERQLETVNEDLRNVIVSFNPQKNSDYQMPPSGRQEPGDLISSQVDYLSKGLTAVQQEQRLQAAEGSREAEMAAAAAATTLAQVQERIEDLSTQLFQILQPVQPSRTPPPDASESKGLTGQLAWVQESLDAVEYELARAKEASTSSSADRDQVDQMDTVLRGLWDIIQTGYASIQQRKADRRRTRLEAGLDDDDEEMSGDDMPISPTEQYSIQAFSTKVQWLYAQATNLKEQKSVLKRQIKQQRELNNKSDAERDAEIQRKTDELQQTRVLLEDSRKDAQLAQKDLETLQLAQASSASSANESAKLVEAQLKERDAEIKRLEGASEELQAKLTKVETEMASISSQLREASDAKQAAESEAAKLAKDMQQKEEELEGLSVMVAELKTEVTIAKAELDGAYGSRSQRAAEAAALQNSSEVVDLKAQVDKLKSELAGTLADFEALTKDTITAERERAELEGRLDDAVASKASLEAEAKSLREKLDTQVGRLQEQLDAERLKVAPTTPTRPGAGASMLSEQFRATMKEERKKFQEELRAEQALRRKLEDEMRALKRSQGPGKSNLSPR